jgi:hypothetical protein
VNQPPARRLHRVGGAAASRPKGSVEDHRVVKWLLRLVLFRVLGSRVMIALAVLAWFRSMLQRGRAASLRQGSPSPQGRSDGFASREPRAKG